MVQMSRSWLVLLVLGLIVSWLGLAFLLGRMTASGPGSLAQASPAEVIPTPSLPTTQVVAPPPHELEVGQPPAPTRPPERPESRPAPSPTPPARKRFEPAEAERVRQYLQTINEIVASTEEMGNPSDFATDLLTQSMLGDTSGFDRLLSQTRACQAQLASIRPPASCKEHYRLLVTQMNASAALLQHLKKALDSSDSTALAGLASQGTRLQGQMRRLQQMSDELRQRSSPPV